MPRQQSYHRERARSSQLENVRSAANKAAVAWGVEDEEAEREARREQTKLIAGLLAARKQAAARAVPSYPSENPDRILVDVRGLADPAHDPSSY